jgi:hypothetical protein
MTDKPEEMKSFFDLRVNGYDEHMASTIEDYSNFWLCPSFPNAIPYKNNRLTVGLMGSFIFPSEPPALTLTGAGGCGGNIIFPLVSPPFR